MGIVTTATDKNQTCIDECNRCAQACLECFVACLNETDVEKRRKCIITLLECSKMCEMSSMFMAIGAHSTKEHCKLCAHICNICAKECAMFEDEHCQKCAQECNTCASECEKMSGM